jgi:hypothetical protein
MGRVSNYVFNRIAYHVGSLTGASCYRLPTEQAGLDPSFAFCHTRLGRIETRDLFEVRSAGQ